MGIEGGNAREKEAEIELINIRKIGLSLFEDHLISQVIEKTRSRGVRKQSFITIA